MSAYSFKTDASVPKFEDVDAFVVFDGVCHFCSRSMRIVFEHEKDPIHFIPTQSGLGRALLAHYDLDPDDPASFIFVNHGRARFSSTGVFALSRKLKGWPALLQVFWIIPRPLTDWLYGIFARRRYNVFGRSDMCLIPSADMKSRLLDFPGENDTKAT